MNEQGKSNQAALALTGPGLLAPVGRANPLVGRAIAELNKPTRAVPTRVTRRDDEEPARKNDSRSVQRLYDEGALRYYRNGDALLQDDDWDGAIAASDKAIALNPNEAAFYSGRAVAKWNRRDLKGAIADFSTAITLQAKSQVMDDLTLADYFQFRGMCRYGQEDYALSIADFEAALETDPDGRWFLYGSIAETLATCADDKVRDGERAIRMAMKACERPEKSNDGWALASLAAAYAEAAQFTAAVRCQKRALEACHSYDRETFLWRLRLYRERKPLRRTGRV
jgi:tetratricopeptide (TPR) repeat protein